jgi:hypothetical protein
MHPVRHQKRPRRSQGERKDVMRRITLIITIALLAASCGGGDGGTDAANTNETPDSGTTPASTTSSPSGTPTEEPFPEGSYRSRPYSEADIRAIVPAKFEEAILETELEGGNAITWTFEFADSMFVWRYAVAGIDATGVDSGAPGTYTATEDTITFIDSGGLRFVAGWELSGDELRLAFDREDFDERVNDDALKWGVTYAMSEPFTKVGPGRV